MKVYPAGKDEKSAGQEDMDHRLSSTELIMRRIALILAFVSVFGFFVKILFF
jgi:hypothetical protein